MMQDIKYVYPDRGQEADESGFCPECQAPLVTTCPVYGKPVVVNTFT